MRDSGGGFWAQYNVITACATAGQIVLAQTRGIALVLFAFGLLMSIPFGGLFIGADWLSTWNWTEIFTPQINSGVEYAIAGAGSASGAALAFRFVLQFLSIIPTASELLAPFFAKYIKIFAGLFIIFSAFDYYTDWPTAAAVAHGIDYTGWGGIAGFGEWLTTVILTLIFSLLVQYLMIIFVVITACAAWVLIFGPARQQA